MGLRGRWRAERRARMGQGEYVEDRTSCDPSLGGSTLGRRRVPLEQAGHGGGRACTALRPERQPRAVQIEANRLATGVVGAEAFDETAVAGLAVVGDDDAVERLLVGAVSGKADGNYDFL